MLMSLGMFPFSLSTLAHEDLSRRTAWRHATAQRVGARDATQYVGPGEESISFGGTAHADLTDGRAQLDRLRKMANTGQAWPLVDGTGTVFGAFIIQTLDEKHKALFPDGTARAIDFSIELLRVDG
ncbi:oxidoreductase [Sphingomonas sp. Leaf22]|uniref:phage tail protein n=1 Tax=Sphingomonas sp. Leaf22 TaxID=1735687 RepID=UPI0007011849|nr:phage tail protein [Sphingomonas sp. Leaf22]KQM79341.1 oxidoreductase [Sphingomonas sp. Leaf22]